MSRREARNIVLTGFMATGKSSVGPKLALRLGYEFVDLDALIETEAGMPIPEIFSTYGEDAFRSLESRMLERVAARARCVIATGGGAIVNLRNLELLRRNGVIVTLTAEPDVILERIGGRKDRPMLQGGEMRDRIRQLLGERAAAYAKADLTVDTSTRSVEEVVTHLLEALEQPENSAQE